MTNLLITNYNFYKKYHNNKLNKIIHLICIPLIYLSSMGLINNNKLLRKYNIPELIYLYYTYIHLKYDIYIGLIANFFYGYLYMLVKNNKKKNKFYLKLHLFSWILQFIGHYIEGKKPALLNGIHQSFTTAPFFVVYEIL